MLEDVRRLAPEISDRSSVIYNGLEMPELAPEPLPFEAPTLLCAGRVVRDKGFDVAVSAFATVRRRFPKARLVIAGDGPARAELEQQAAEMGVREAVDFLGWVPPEKIPALMNSATLALVPSRWREAFGLVALQAMQMARPVVASDVGGLPEVVAHGETGLVVPKEDPEVVAQAVTRLLENPSLAQEMGAAGRRRASLLFGFDRYLEEHEILYRRLLKETRHDQFEPPLDATL
jgi:glycogen(starch) synthase